MSNLKIKTYICMFFVIFITMIVPFSQGKVHASPTVYYCTHVSNIGWMPSVTNGSVAGTVGQARQMEAIQIDVTGLDGGVKYRAHVADIGWMNWVTNRQTAGTTGQARRMEAIQIQLTGNAANQYDIYYRTHVSNIGWMNWVKNGEIAGTVGRSLQMEAIEIKVVPKSDDYSTKIKDFRNSYRVSTNGLNLNLRSGMSNTASIIAKMPKDSIVTGADQGNGWARVTYNGMTGYASMQYLSRVTDPTPNPNTNKIANALTWLDNNLGRTIGINHQCVSTVKAYAERLGLPHPVDYGNACDYSKNPLNSGWTRVKGGVPQAGDILVYCGGKYGHVAIYAGNNTIYESNMSDKVYGNNLRKRNRAYNQGWYSSAEGGNKYYWGYIRPNV